MRNKQSRLTNRLFLVLVTRLDIDIVCNTLDETGLRDRKQSKSLMFYKNKVEPQKKKEIPEVLKEEKTAN